MIWFTTICNTAHSVWCNRTWSGWRTATTMLCAFSALILSIKEQSFACSVMVGSMLFQMKRTIDLHVPAFFYRCSPSVVFGQVWPLPTTNYYSSRLHLPALQGNLTALCCVLPDTCSCILPSCAVISIFLFLSRNVCCRKATWPHQ